MHSLCKDNKIQSFWDNAQCTVIPNNIVVHMLKEQQAVQTGLQFFESPKGQHGWNSRCNQIEESSCLPKRAGLYSAGNG